MRQSQKLESLGLLAGGIAHDFNNILSGVIGYTELAMSKIGDNPSLEKNLKAVLTAGHRAKDLVSQILAFARQTGEEAKPVRLADSCG